MSKLQAATNPFETELQLIVKLYFSGGSKKALSLSTRLASHFKELATILSSAGPSTQPYSDAREPSKNNGELSK